MEKQIQVFLRGARHQGLVCIMTGYLELENDVLDDCPEGTTVEWYSHSISRVHEADFGPIHRHITRRLGPGREIQIDMRGVLFSSDISSASAT